MSDKNRFKLDDKKDPMLNNKGQRPKNIMVVLVVLMMALVIIFIINQDRSSTVVEIDYSDFVKKYLNSGFVSNVTIENRKIVGTLKPSIPDNLKTSPSGKFSTYIPLDDKTLLSTLLEQNVKVKGEPESDGVFFQIITNLLPWLLILGVLWFIMFRQIQGSGNKAMSFGKSRARLQKPNQKKVTFKDVAGVDEAKEELQDVVEFLKDPDKFKKLGAKIPKGVLLMGPPGTGKTLLARAIAGEADSPFFSMSGSDFVEMFVGVGASRVRDLFEQGKKHKPCILFIDELDAVGRVRGAGYGGGHDEREQTLNQMLVEMDGFETDDAVIIIGATNRPDVLDPALLRPGRFDRQIVVSSPDVKGREFILRVHMKKIPVAKSVNVKKLARGTPGFSGADLMNLVNESALVAAKKNKRKVQMEDFEYAKDKVLMGPERKSLVINDKEKKNTAYHEAGHALLGLLLPNVDPVHKVSIIPRGRALGVTQSLPIDDRYTLSKQYCIESIMMLLGGRIAEKVFMGEQGFSNGAANDIERATKLARSMVCEWGMSDVLGPLNYGQTEEPIFIGKEIARHKDYSEQTAVVIDAEIKKIVENAYSEAQKIMEENKDKLQKLAATLLEREVMDSTEIEELLGIEAKNKPKNIESADDEEESDKEKEIDRVSKSKDE